MKRPTPKISDDVAVQAARKFEIRFPWLHRAPSTEMRSLVPDAIVRAGDVICILFRPRLDYASDACAFSGRDLRAIAEKLVKIADASEPADG